MEEKLICQQVVKITIKDERITIKYEEVRGADIDGFRMVEYSSVGKPLDSFRKAIADLMIDVIKSCYLDYDAWCEGDVTGIGIKYHEDGYGLNVSATLLGDRAININTPYLSPEYCCGETEERIEAVIRGAKGYMEGERQTVQMQLFEMAS